MLQQIHMKLGGVKNTASWECQAVCPDRVFVVFVLSFNSGLTESSSETNRSGSPIYETSHLLYPTMAIGLRRYSE